MVNTHLLRYYIAKNNDTTEQLADYLKISRSALSAKMNNKREFTVMEAALIADRYNLNCKRSREVFCWGFFDEDRRSC